MAQEGGGCVFLEKIRRDLAVYVVFIGSLCTTGWAKSALRPDFVDVFSFCSQIPVLQVFYLYEQKMTSAVRAAKQAPIFDPWENHQQSYPQAAAF
ncbi:hypothetical protein JFT91_07525 [Pseudomonas sp. TH08]|uniref:hypothetical protein n=1 Tax=Pseudomonas sp. TH08 TaxID=2796374 RepID=UPI001912A916|nr:hypothetical protein [Pseudomonas sp. TH08]MBK5532457.1 hypothetical protein [Pseudomonas sp. TH08]